MTCYMLLQDNAFNAIRRHSNKDHGMTHDNWLSGLLVIASLQSLNFLRLTYAVGVYSVFGRRSMSASSLTYLFLMATVPAVSVIPYFAGPFSLVGIDEVLENVVVLASTTVASHPIMTWLSLGVRLPIRSE